MKNVRDRIVTLVLYICDEFRLVRSDPIFKNAAYIAAHSQKTNAAI